MHHGASRKIDRSFRLSISFAVGIIGHEPTALRTRLAGLDLLQRLGVPP